MVVLVWGQVCIWTESLGQAGLGLCLSLLRPWLRAWVRHSGMGANRKQRKEGGRQFIPWGGGGHKERATQDLNSVTRDLDCFPRETCDLTLLSALCPELRDWWMRAHAQPRSYTLGYHSNSVHTVCVWTRSLECHSAYEAASFSISDPQPWPQAPLPPEISQGPLVSFPFLFL